MVQFCLSSVIRLLHNFFDLNVVFTTGLFFSLFLLPFTIPSMSSFTVLILLPKTESYQVFFRSFIVTNIFRSSPTILNNFSFCICSSRFIQFLFLHILISGVSIFLLIHSLKVYISTPYNTTLQT